MRKPLKFYLFFLLLITAFGLLGNVLIQDEPNLEATDINSDIPGSEAMVAMYEPLAATLGENAIIDIAVLPMGDSYDVELLLEATTTEEVALQQQTIDVLQLVGEATTTRTVHINWLQGDDSVLSLAVDAPLPTTPEVLVQQANSYTYTP